MNELEMMDYETSKRWLLERELKDKRERQSGEKTGRYSLQEKINEGAETWRINCIKWEEIGQKVGTYAGNLDELNKRGPERYELINLSDLKEDFRKAFNIGKAGGERVYYYKFLRNNNCKAGLGAIGADALIHFEKRFFSSSGIPVKIEKKN